MAELTPDMAADVVEACKKGADEAAEAIGRSLDAVGMKVTVGESGTVDTKALPDAMAGPGLAVVMILGEAAVLALLPESSGLVPSWCAEPDATGESKLTTLAQELGMILLPEAFMPDDFKAGWVKNLSGAIARGCVADSAALVPLELTARVENRHAEPGVAGHEADGGAWLGSRQAQASRETAAAARAGSHAPPPWRGRSNRRLHARRRGWKACLLTPTVS